MKKLLQYFGLVKHNLKLHIKKFRHTDIMVTWANRVAIVYRFGETAGRRERASWENVEGIRFPQQTGKPGRCQAERKRSPVY
jgi:hypothetical protein